MADRCTVSGMTAPDGGWGWLVVVGSFMLQGITVGITYTFGILYVDLLDHFKESESLTAWIGSIQAFLMYSTGMSSVPNQTDQLLPGISQQVLSTT